jgi:hypothetical protein
VRRALFDDPGGWGIGGSHYGSSSKRPTRVTHLFRVCGVVIRDVASLFVSVGCGGGPKVCDASGGVFPQVASHGWRNEAKS